MHGEDLILESQLALLNGVGHQEQHEISSTPVFTKSVLEHFRPHFNQYGFIAGLSAILNSDEFRQRGNGSLTHDPRLFFNISAPSSVFICGSQGSGKSHTLSCLLENCLMKSQVSQLDSPLAGLLFHYDSFTSDVRGTPCEAAHLASNPNIKVRVLCSPTNLSTIKRTYTGMNVQIEALRINQSDLNTQRMMDLMAVNQDEGSMPLYLHAINRILRDLRIKQQESGGTFNYSEFKRQVLASGMTPAQLAPLNQRLDTLESFMPKSQTKLSRTQPASAWTTTNGHGNDWAIQPGSLTIVDLSCPCVTAEGACALFNMCLSMFLEQKTRSGRVVALDEAHKYMGSASEATSLTKTLLSSIRLQRHLGTRVFISTQEPTISPKLLDLCSITFVHRFTSPDWLRCLKAHLAAFGNNETGSEAKAMLNSTFDEIVKLRVGEALMFAPSAIINARKSEVTNLMEMKKLGVGYLKIRIRARVTSDGGKSVLAMGSFPVQASQSNVPKSTTKTLFDTAKQGTTNHPRVDTKSTSTSTATTGIFDYSQSISTGSTARSAATTSIDTSSLVAFGSPINHAISGNSTHLPILSSGLGPPSQTNASSNPAVASNITPLVSSTTTFGQPSPASFFGAKATAALESSTALPGKFVFGQPSPIHNSLFTKTPGFVFGASANTTGSAGFQWTHSPSPAITPTSSTPPAFTVPPPPQTQPTSKLPQFRTQPSSNDLTQFRPGPDDKFPFDREIFHKTSIDGHFPPQREIFQLQFCPSTVAPKFSPFIEKEPDTFKNQMNAFQHIAFTSQFMKFSPEEMRLADYKFGLKGK